MSSKVRNPGKLKVTQKWVKSRFSGNSGSRSESRSKSRFSCENFFPQENLLFDLLSDLLPEFPENLLLTYF